MTEYDLITSRNEHEILKAIVLGVYDAWSAYGTGYHYNMATNSNFVTVELYCQSGDFEHFDVMIDYTLTTRQHYQVAKQRTIENLRLLCADIFTKEDLFCERAMMGIF